MLEMTCPWCETELRVALQVEETEQTCGECRTAWLLAPPPDQELALAA